MMMPKKGLGEEKDKKFEEKLAQYKNSLTEKEIEELVEKNKKLTEKQLTPDTPEDKATIPQLSISDVDAKAKVIPQEIIKDGDITLLHHDIFTSKIAYVDFIFDVSMVDKELIPYINLLTEIIGKIDTETMSYSELSNEIYANTGGINLNPFVYVENGNDEIFYPKLIVQGKAIGDKVNKLLELTSELISASKIEDKKRIKEIIQQLKSRLEISIYDMGHIVSSGRVASYFSPTSKYGELLNGLDFYWFICDIVENFDDNSDEILYNLEKVYKMVFNKNNLILSFTGSSDDFRLVKDNLNVVTSKLNAEKFEAKDYDFSETKENEGILSPANVQYVSKGYNFKKLGYEYNGNMRVLATILSIDYLHNRIRAKGGAYGCGISFGRSGNVLTHSYRDPNLEETITVYDNIAKYIEDLNLDEDELTQYIIGTISQLDPATTPHMKGQMATAYYICHISQEDIQKERDEVLNTKLNDIKPLSQMLNDIMKQNYCCVLGNENKIKENKDLFNKLVPLKK